MKGKLNFKNRFQIAKYLTCAGCKESSKLLLDELKNLIKACYCIFQTVNLFAIVYWSNTGLIYTNLKIKTGMIKIIEFNKQIKGNNLVRVKSFYLFWYYPTVYKIYFNKRDCTLTTIAYTFI
jgi:hypothetical protein